MENNDKEELILETDNEDEEEERKVKQPKFCEYKVASMDEVTPGDHIVISIRDNKATFRHCILIKINDMKNFVELVYFDDQDQQEQDDADFHINDMLVDVERKQIGLNGVKKAECFVNLARLDVYKVDYAEAGSAKKQQQKMLDPSETIAKAEKLIGSVKYNIFVNNDEHFAVYCKTGKAAKLFVVVHPDELTNGKELAQKVSKGMAQEGTQIMLVNTARHIATQFPRSVMSASLPVVEAAAGGVLNVGFESVSMTYDIYQKRKELRDGQLTDMSYKKYVAKRATRGAMGVTGSIAGGVIGQMVIPIPVVGAMIGSVVGGVFGSLAGHGEGILLGEAIEAIDNRQKEKQVQKDKELESKVASLGGELDPTKGVENLVVKFEKDVLKPEKWTHLDNKDTNNNNQQQETTKQQAPTTEVNKTTINDEDFDIFIVEDANQANEIMKAESQEEQEEEADKLENELNEKNPPRVEKRGIVNRARPKTAVLDRNSLQLCSADQLPSNLDIYLDAF